MIRSILFLTLFVTIHLDSFAQSAWEGEIPQPSILVIASEDGKQLGAFPQTINYLRLGLLSDQTYSDFDPKEALFVAEYFELNVLRGAVSLTSIRLDTPYLEADYYGDIPLGQFFKKVQIEVKSGDRISIKAINIQRSGKPFSPNVIEKIITIENW